jgi:hypothetical protein
LRGNIKKLRDSGCGYTAEEEEAHAIQVPKTPNSGRGRPKTANAPKSGGLAKRGADEDEDDEVEEESPSKKPRGGGRKKAVVKAAETPAVHEDDGENVDVKKSAEDMHHGQFFDAMEDMEEV